MSWLEQAPSKIESLLRTQRSPSDAMAELVAWCAAARPHPDWAGFAKLEVDAELPRLEQWLRGVLSDEPPATTITAYWFGLFNPCDDDDNVGADVYVSGSDRFTGDVDGEDWNCSPAYWPEARHAESRVLWAIYDRAYRSESSLMNDAEYPLALGYAAFAIAHLCRVISPRVWLAGARERAVIVGFDDGDMIEIGVVRADGFVLATSQAGG